METEVDLHDDTVGSFSDDPVNGIILRYVERDAFCRVLLVRHGTDRHLSKVDKSGDW